MSLIKLHDELYVPDNFADDHSYFADAEGTKPYTGITTILGVIAKPALIQWAANMAVDYIESLARTRSDGERYVLLDIPEFKEARYAHRKKKEDAGDAGTALHERIEIWVKDCINYHDGWPHAKETPKEIESFVEWAKNNGIRFISSEHRVFSRALWIAGTFDLLLEQAGKRLIADVKTSKAIYPQYFYQMAAYRLMLEEMGEKDIEGAIVIRLNGGIETQYRYDYETDKQAFLGALAIYRANATYGS